MSQFLKQSTAAVIPFGPFVDPVDGVTLVTGLVSALDHASTGIFLSKNGGAKAIRHATVTATTYDAHGDYLVTLDATDTGTLGRLRVSFAAAGSCLPVWQDFHIVPANIFDSLVSGSDLLDVSVTQWLGTAVSTPTVAGVPNVNVKTWNDLATVALPLVPTVPGRALDVAPTGEAGLDFDNIKDASGAHTLTNITVPVVTAVTNDVGITQAGADKVWGTTVRALTDKVGFALSAAGIQAIWDALTSALTTAGSIGKLLVDNINATISSRLASASYTTPPTVGAIADQVWDEVLSGHLTAGTTGAALNASGSAGDPWATALPGAYGAGTAGKIVGDNLNATVSSRATQTSVDTIDDFLDTEIAAIKAKTDNLPADPADESNVLAAIAAIPAAPSATVIADAFLDRDMAAGTDSGSPTFRTVRQALRYTRNKREAVAGTLNVYKEDDATLSYTAVLTTDAAALPVTKVDPAGP